MKWNTTMQMYQDEGIAWRKAWGWKRNEARLYAGLVKGTSLHVCAGAAELGDVKLDLTHPWTDVKADAMKLPFRDNMFDTCICDPPWLHGVELRILKELRRVTKHRIIFITMNKIWFPSKSNWTLTDMYVLLKVGHSQHNIKGCYVFDNNANQSLEEYQ